MYESHYYTLHKVCPCKISKDIVNEAFRIHRASVDIPTFAANLEHQRIIGKRIWFDKEENTIYISKIYACDTGGGCPDNKSMIGERCHCVHYNHSKECFPKYYCKCGAEFYRPLFAPIFGSDVLIEPYKTVLSGDEECVIAVRIGKTEGQHHDA